MNDNHIQNPRKIHLIIGIVVGLIVIATITAFILKAAVPKTTKPVVVGASSASVSSLVSQYATPGTITALPASSYTVTKLAPSTTIYYKASGHSYAIELPSTSTAVFMAVSKTQTNDSSTVLGQTDAFMTKQGLTQIGKNQQFNHLQANYTTYANQDIVCQLIDNTLNPYNAGSYTFDCASTANVNSLYATASQLMTIYKKTNSINDFGDIGIQTITDSNKSLAIVNVRAIQLSMTNPDFKTLLFVSVGGTWQYVSELVPQQNDTSVTYQRTDAIKAALNNATYGAFLTKNLP